ncbi:MAG TPA: mucoidy inhibitor MuiA family protein, partial [Rhodobacteraceae bacterium]|nr:mucoidy inhibitor MuiA family protein [Paracoccaceae bacterium]
RNLATIYENAPVAKLSSTARMASGADMAMAEPVMVEEAVIMASAQFDGLSLRYVYPRKVTLENNETVQLVLDSFNLPVETNLLAIPRRDETAFVMAAITNDTGEPLLPGMASYYRDGAFIGRNDIALIPAGAETDLPFGAMDGVRLTYTALRQETGDSGIITTSNTREDVVEFSIENLTDRPQEVRALYALPYSQQEDLVVSTRIRPNPTETDVDDVRGLAAWDMTIEPGETRTVRLTTSLSWPKDFILNWAQ